MSLLDQSLWWLVPYILLVLLMLQAMMEFTVSLLVERPPKKRTPVPASELEQRLLAESQESQPYRLVEGEDCDLEIVWEQDEYTATERTLIAKSASRSHIRFLFDETRHDLRVNQVSRSFFFLIGITGWLPRLQGYASAQSGPPDAAMTKEISQIANRSGWSVRPVIWWFQATRRGFHLLEKMTPRPLRGWSARRFWGILYPLSFLLMIAYLIAVTGGLAWDDLWLIVLVSAGWWGVWGFLVWMLLGFPPFWRGRGRKQR
jgi:hypothetical protein